jgi:inhibitor of KinA
MRLEPPAAPRFLPLGDQAVLVYFAAETDAARFARAVGRASYPWQIDVTPAYASVAVFYRPEQIGYRAATEQLQSLAASLPPESDDSAATRHFLPCCYELGLDLARIAEQTGLSAEDAIRLHLATEYQVYAIGFCPGFPYLGYLPDALAGVPRLPAPRLRVEVGSVGMTGRQTGVYTEERPGGWNIVGRTPLELVSVVDGYFPLRTGDRVRFRRIDDTEFHRLRGERL